MGTALSPSSDTVRALARKVRRGRVDVVCWSGKLIGPRRKTQPAARSAALPPWLQRCDKRDANRFGGRRSRCGARAARPPCAVVGAAAPPRRPAPRRARHRRCAGRRTPCGGHPVDLHRQSGVPRWTVHSSSPAASPRGAPPASPRGRHPPPALLLEGRAGHRHVARGGRLHEAGGGVDLQVHGAAGRHGRKRNRSRRERDSMRSELLACRSSASGGRNACQVIECRSHP